mmetsp:Transcript_1748/g.6398  ORF Transcript_1748/g.6398 Transcript_1748/m.6398 type:complete len:201 (-) Transcript_1748:897-1499(-)
MVNVTAVRSNTFGDPFDAALVKTLPDATPQGLNMMLWGLMKIRVTQLPQMVEQDVKVLTCPHYRNINLPGQGFFLKPRIMVPVGVRLEDAAESEDHVEIEYENLSTAQTAEFVILAALEYGYRRIIAFLPEIKDAEDFAKAMAEAADQKQINLPVAVYELHSNVNLARRDNVRSILYDNNPAPCSSFATPWVSRTHRSPE